MNEEELIQETRRLIERWDNVRVVGLGWSGDPRRGFQFNPTDVRTGGGGSGGTPPPPTTSGACCPTSGDCFIATQSICEAGGGTYQGDDTTCDPDPCPPLTHTGACCTDTTCSVGTPESCVGMYLGDGTNCGPPNPCGAGIICDPGLIACGSFCCSPDVECCWSEGRDVGCCPDTYTCNRGYLINHCCGPDQAPCPDGSCCSTGGDVICCGPHPINGDYNCCNSAFCIGGVCV